MRQFTSLFKRLLGLGFEHASFILDSWAVVRAAAQVQLELTKQPGLANSIAFVDKVLALVANLPKPKPRKPGDPDDDDDDDEDEQQDLIAPEKPKPGTEAT